MGLLDEELIDRDFPWLVTLDEALLLCVEHIDAARECQNALSLGLELKMASRALRCAMEVYGMRLAKEK